MLLYKVFFQAIDKEGQLEDSHTLKYILLHGGNRLCIESPVAFGKSENSLEGFKKTSLTIYLLLFLAPAIVPLSIVQPFAPCNSSNR